MTQRAETRSATGVTVSDRRGATDRVIVNEELVPPRKTCQANKTKTKVHKQKR